jgi:hypothetical protein
MKTKGLMIAALFISGAAFAQSTTVKQEQQVKVSNGTRADAATATPHANAQATATAQQESAVTVDPSAATPHANAQATAAAQQEGAVTVDPSAAAAAKSAVKSNAESGVKAVQATGDQLEKQTVQTAKMATGHVNSVTATAARSTMHVNGAINNSLKVKAAPIKVNTLTAGAVGLKGL